MHRSLPPLISFLPPSLPTPVLLTVSVWGSPPGCPDSGPSGRRPGLCVPRPAVLAAACRSAPAYRPPGSSPAAGSPARPDCDTSWSSPESSPRLLKERRGKVRSIETFQVFSFSLKRQYLCLLRSTWTPFSLFLALFWQSAVLHFSVVLCNYTWDKLLIKPDVSSKRCSYKQRGTSSLICVPCVGVCALTCDKVGVVAALAELHHGVNEVWHVVLVCSFGQEGEVLL